MTVGNRLLDYQSSGTGLSCFGDAQGEYGAWLHAGRHAGAIRDSETPALERAPGTSDGGLSFFRNRWYDGNTGRFTQEDPIGFAGGLSLYVYSANNPASGTDPFGLKVCFDRLDPHYHSTIMETGDAVGMNLKVGRDGCVSSAEARKGSSGLSTSQSEFQKPHLGR